MHILVATAETQYYQQHSQLPSLSNFGNMNNQGHYQMHALPAVQGQATAPAATTGHIPAQGPPPGGMGQLPPQAPLHHNQVTPQSGAENAQQIAGYRPLNVNDALSYLDQVKVQFQSQPDVYNHFLDIMKDFKSHKVTTPRGTTSGPDGEPTVPYENQWQQQNSQQHQQKAEGYPGYAARQPTTEATGNGVETSMSQLHAAANGNRTGQAEARRPGDPVEFNQAISYVNKIKTRFSSQPEIYKTFLEILQTYQREQLRITEVYEQVTQLFQEAPDLLDDFRQFLPDMSQQQRSVEMTPTDNNVRLPPVGNFAPPLPGSNAIQEQNLPTPNLTSLNNQPATVPAPAQPPRTKKKASGQDNQYDNSNIAVSNIRGPPTKKSKASNGVISPSLVPATPEPLLTQKSGALLEEISFFDKAKKYISNKQTYNEFLKVLNLFSQRIIDKDILIDRVNGFLGGNDELMTWFKNFVKYEGKPLHIENITYKKHLLELSRCRAYGKSYRLLPKSETYMPCSGRDEMCWEVLNDEWVGHPTWASEEAGFVAHRKNQYEEIMHRCEEERLEYDYYIEANLRSIQTLETLNSRIASMTQEEKVLFKLPPNLGHTSTIYAKVLKKIYGEPRYHEVVDALMETPATSVPIVLKRMKQKDEEWRRAHREWNKVWRDTEQKVFYKSLDHRGLTFKQTDKKNLTTRQLVSEIITVKTEQNNKRLNPLTPKPKDQLVYYVKDNSVLVDMYKLVLIFLEHSNSYSHNDRERMVPFFRTFLNLFFSLPEDLLEVPDKSEEEEEEEENADVSTDSKPVTKRGRDDVEHLKDLLKKSKHARIEKQREEENNDDEKSKEEEAFEEIEKSGELWLRHINASSTGDLFEQRPRHTFNLFANSTVYVFFRLINILYERLEEVKGYETVVSNEIAGSRIVQFAKDLELYDKRLEEMGLQFDKDDCYGQLLKLVEKLIEGDLEHQWYEESIRQAYRNRAYKLYTVDKVLQAIVKHLHTIVSDVKSSDVLVLFERDRLQSMSNVKEQILYRMRVKSVLGSDENMFRIEWDENEKRALIQFLGHDDITLKQTKTDEEKWNYYLTSYLMTNPTEGVPVDRVQLPFMHRNITEDNEAEDLFGAIEQGLTARVCDSTYKLFFEANSEDFFSRKVGATAEESTKTALDQQKARFHDFLNGPQGWKSELTEDEVAAAEDKFKTWVSDGPDALKDWKPKVREPEAESETKPESEKSKETVIVKTEALSIKDNGPAPESSEEISQPVDETKTDESTVSVATFEKAETLVVEVNSEEKKVDNSEEQVSVVVAEDVEMPDADTADTAEADEPSQEANQPAEVNTAAKEDEKEKLKEAHISTPVATEPNTESNTKPNAEPNTEPDAEPNTGPKAIESETAVDNPVTESEAVASEVVETKDVELDALTKPEAASVPKDTSVKANTDTTKDFNVMNASDSMMGSTVPKESDTMKEADATKEADTTKESDTTKGVTSMETPGKVEEPREQKELNTEETSTVSASTIDTRAPVADEDKPVEVKEETEPTTTTSVNVSVEPAPVKDVDSDVKPDVSTDVDTIAAPADKTDKAEDVEMSG